MQGDCFSGLAGGLGPNEGRGCGAAGISSKPGMRQQLCCVWPLFWSLDQSLQHTPCFDARPTIKDPEIAICLYPVWDRHITVSPLMDANPMPALPLTCCMKLTQGPEQAVGKPSTRPNMIRSAVPCASDTSKGGRPAMSSYTRTPTAQMSTLSV